MGIQVAMGQFNNRYSTPTHLAYGILMGSNAPNVTVDRAISLRGDGNWALGLDFATAKMTGLAVYLSENQRIAFDGGDSGGYNRSLRACLTGLSSRALVFCGGADVDGRGS